MRLRLKADELIASHVDNGESLYKIANKSTIGYPTIRRMNADPFQKCNIAYVLTFLIQGLGIPKEQALNMTFGEVFEIVNTGD